MSLSRRLSTNARGLLLSCLACFLLVQSSHFRAAQASYLSIAQQQQQQSSTAAQSNDQLAPSIIPFSFDQNWEEGQRLSVMCTTSSGENPVSFTWLKDGQTLPQQTDRRVGLVVKHDQDSSTLKISSVRLDHAGNYTCLARNRFGSQVHSSQLVVHGQPRWLRKPSDEPIVATRGQTVTIDCQTTGWPKPQQTWKIKTHNKVEFEPLAFIGGRISVSPSGSLVIKNADKSDEANYRCESSNGFGRALSGLTSLKVNVPAYFEAAAKQQTSIVRKGSQVQLRCDAYGDQPITIEWFKNKLPFASAGSTTDLSLLVSDARHSIHSNINPLKNGLISQLHIKQALRQDNSIYECVAKNPHGRDRLPIELIVQEEPDNIQDIQVGPINSRSVTLMWNEPYDGRSSITSYMFQYKRVQEAASSPLLLNEFDFVDSLQSIESQHHHHQQAGSKVASGSTLDGDWQHAQRMVLAMNESSATGSVKSITIDKLEPSSKYLLRALAINAIGQSKFSQPMEFSTDEEAPEVGPVNIQAKPINSTSIHVSWDEIPRSKHPGRIHGYYIGYRVATNNSAAVNFIHKPYIINDLVTPTMGVQQVAPSGQQAPSGDLTTASQSSAGQAQQQHSNPGQPARLETIIQDLRRDTVYEITVLAFNRRGSGPSSDFVVCKTIEMEAPKAVKLAVSRELNESIYIEWQRDPTDQNPVDYYVLYQEKNSNSAEVRLPGNQTHYRAPSLKCGTRYQFYMIAHNKEGKSPPSEVVSASTSGSLPVVPSKTSLIKWINSTCLLINLNSFQDNGCRINFFSVRYRVEKQQQQMQPGDANQVAGSSSSMIGSSTVTSSSSGPSTGSSNANSIAQVQSGAVVGSSGSMQLIGANGVSASHQALTAAGQLGAKSVLANQVANAANSPYASEWIAIRPKGNLKQQRANDEDRLEYLCDLSPVGEYTIHVAAGNDVGRSEIEYTVLMSSDELRLSALKEMMELMSGLPNFIAYIPSILVFLLAALSLIIVCLILYTTAIKYYQKFVIMQNQMRATRRAKADEKRRRKLASGNSSASARHNQKMADLWADEYEDGDMMHDDDEDDDDDGDCDGGDNLGASDRQRIVASSEDSEVGRDIDGDDEDEATDELQSNSSHELRIGRVTGRGQLKSGFDQQQGATRGRDSNQSHRYRTLQHKQQQLLRPHANQHLHPQHYHKYSGSSPQHGHHYLSNLASSAFDSSSIDSPCSSSNNKPFASGSACMSTASNDSVHGRFQCLSAKQYVKMNEYSMLPTISASLVNPANDIYGTTPARGPTNQALTNVIQQQQQQRHSSPMNGPAQLRPINGTSPGANSSASNTTNSAASNQQNPNSMYYSTLRRTNMQTYLPQQQQQLQRRQSQNMADIYGYYMAPPAQAQAAAAAAVAAQQQAANEAANSIFVPPQQIIYSAPNIRRQPSVLI